MTNTSNSEVVVSESVEVRELLGFLFYLNSLSKLWQLQRKHSKYMFDNSLIFRGFIKILAACMHAFCMLYLHI